MNIEQTDQSNKNPYSSTFKRKKYITINVTSPKRQILQTERIKEDRLFSSDKLKNKYDLLDKRLENLKLSVLKDKQVDEPNKNSDSHSIMSSSDATRESFEAVRMYKKYSPIKKLVEINKQLRKET